MAMLYTVNYYQKKKKRLKTRIVQSKKTPINPVLAILYNFLLINV